MSDEVVPQPVSEIDALTPADEKEEKESTPAELPDQDEDEEGKEDKDKPAGESGEEEEKEEELAEEQEETPKAIRFSEIKKEFPELFKKYPDLRANYFQAEKFKEYFPTVEDAESAAKKAEMFELFEGYAAAGDLTSEYSILETLARNKPQVLPKIADEIIPKLFELDKKLGTNLYSRATAPVITSLLRFTHSEAIRMNNTDGENLKNSVGHIAKFLNGLGIRLNGNENREAPREDPEKIQLQQQNQALLSNTAGNYESEVYTEAFDKTKSEVQVGLNDEKKLNNWQLDKLTEDIIREVGRVLESDANHQREMQSLWNRAMQSGFPRDMKAKIINARLARAKMIIPAIRQKLKSEALGVRTPEKTNQKRTLIPQNSGPVQHRSKVLSAKEAKKEGLSEMDFLNRL